MAHQTCKKCFKKMRFEFNIQDGIWDKIPKKWRNHALCIECFLELLEKECPDEKLKLTDFRFIGVIGVNRKKKFGGILLDE